MPLNLKLHHRTMLSHHIQINMFVVLSLDSFFGLFMGHNEHQSLFSCSFTKEVPGPHRLSTSSTKSGRRRRWQPLFSFLKQIRIGGCTQNDKNFYRKTRANVVSKGEVLWNQIKTKMPIFSNHHWILYWKF